MRTTITIDDAKADELMRRNGTDSLPEAIRLAVNEEIRRHRVADFMQLAGKFPHLHVEAKRAEKISLADAKRAHR